MRIFNKEEAFVHGYEVAMKNPLPFDAFIGVFHTENDPAVRGAEENPSDCGIIVDESTASLLSSIFTKLDKKHLIPNDLDVLRYWAGELRGSYPLTAASTKVLYKRLKEKYNI